MFKPMPVFLTGTVLLLSLVFLVAAVRADSAKKKSTLRLQSTSFKDGGMIPSKYASCDGEHIPGIELERRPSQNQGFRHHCG